MKPMQVAVGILFGVVLLQAQAGAAVYEGFDITPGPGALSGASGATSSGWTNNWTVGASNNVLASGLLYGASVRDLVSTGGAAQLATNTGSFRSFTPVYSTATGSVWVSFLGRIPTNASFSGLSLFNVFNNEFVFAGCFGPGSTTWGLRTYGTSNNPGVIVNTAFPLAYSAFVVTRMDFNISGTLDEVHVWINPELADTPPDDGDAILAQQVEFVGATTAANFNRVRLQQGSGGVNGVFDEIRIGGAWGDVAPSFEGGPRYQVGYDANGATGGAPPVDSTDYAPAQIATVLGNDSNLVKRNFSFSGWNTAADGSGQAYFPGSSFQMGSSNVTLYARWTNNLVAYEPFDYPAGTGALAGASGGTGWTNAWTTGAFHRVIAEGFNYSSAGDLVASGGVVQLVPSGAENAAFRSFKPAYSTATGSVWLSFIGRVPSNSSYSGLSLVNPNNEMLFVGDLSGETNWGAQAFGVNGAVVTSSIPVSAQAFIVVRVDFDVSGALDNARIWINPPLTDLAPDNGTATMSLLGVEYSGNGTASRFNRIRLQQGVAGDNGIFDEIRIGRAWEDVAPVNISGVELQPAELTWIRAAGGQVLLGLSSLTVGATNDLLRSHNLLSGAWDTASTFVATAVTGLVADAVSSSNQVYYRIYSY